MDKIQKVPFKVMPRAETGPLEFIDDWPGVFVRGDDAFAYAMYIRNILEYIEVNDINDYIAVANLKSLAELLESCNINAL